MTSARLARLTRYIYILPAVLVMLAGLMYPILSAVQLSFYDWSMGTEFDTARFVGLDAFVEMLTSGQVWTSMGITVAFVLIAASAELVLGVALALFLHQP